MSDDRQRCAERIFRAVIEADAAAQTGILRDECAGDEELQAEVLSLLDHHARGDGLLDRDVLPAAARSGSHAARTGGDAAELPPQCEAGGYRLLDVLGSGGMGIVYRAEQERPRRLVALKVLRSSAASAGIQRRFEHEAELLARLQHPGIAHIFETGRIDFGHGPQQFIAMELIDGEPLTTWARRRELDPRMRLRLMVRICDAVHHAHLRGVIHRDLKPANILVVDEDAPTTSAAGSAATTVMPSGGGPSEDRTIGRPKILDFGVARVMQGDMQLTAAPQTMTGQLIGTLRYMSPEQVGGDPQAIDTRSDVYALGVILYELLSGRPPYDLDGRAIPDAAGIIRDRSPTALSSINRLYRGDIDTIVGKALEKDPDRRYQSAAEMARDIELALADKPIVARPPSAAYQFHKFVKRNKAIVAGVAGIILALVLGMIGTTATMLQYRAQRNEAARQARIAEAVNEFLNQDLLAMASPSNEPDRDLTVRQALDNASQRIHGRFADEPLVRAAILTTIGQAYSGLGEYGPSEAHFREALDLHRSTLGESDPRSIRSVGQLATALRNLNRDDEAETLYVEALRLGGAALAPDDNIVLTAKNNLGLLFFNQHRLAEAVPLFVEVLRARERTLGEEHAETMAALNNLAIAYERLGRYEESEALQKRDYEISLRLLGEQHPDTMQSMHNLAVLYATMGRFDDSEAMYRRTLELRRRVQGEQHPDTLTTMGSLVVLYLKMQRYEDAERMGRESAAATEAALGPEHEHTIYVMYHHAAALGFLHRAEEAEALFQRALELCRRILGERHIETAFCELALGRFLRQERRFDEARALGEHSYDIFNDVYGPLHEYTLRSVDLMAGVYDDWGRPDDAAAWRARRSGP